jgi:predicted mannosyl-3-phosphoglycerate phosphatase (HAD superfamily)
MNNTKQMCEELQRDLKKIKEELKDFLNYQSIKDLGSLDEENIKYYEGFLFDLRHLSVFSEMYYEKVSNILRRPSFNEEQAKKCFYETYQNCINSFFYPKYESYSEDGRYAYTGQDSIRFRRDAKKEFKKIVISLSKTFEKIREDLHYFENYQPTQNKS